jgi:hypothetical protein
MNPTRSKPKTEACPICHAVITVGGAMTNHLNSCKRNQEAEEEQHKFGTQYRESILLSSLLNHEKLKLHRNPAPGTSNPAAAEALGESGSPTSTACQY